ncbi:GyrI-like domain-containing protein [Aestuariibius sp. HNIBRBA575]|uniref:AraC family transcriptional regulator n=1 Tax=Aestuariibius sp. HNIBRBA575 TaxID=3233343 RepID=UPI0034A14C83
MSASYEKRLLRVLDYIHANPTGDLSLDNLAEVAAMSRFHWHRVFHAMTGETCAEVVRRMRLHRAACWLVQTDWPVADVAAKVGYPSPQSFSRTFKAAFGLSPVSYRARGDLTAAQIMKSKGDFAMFDVKIENRAALTLAGMAHKGPYLEIGSKFEQVAAVATSRNLWPSTRGMAGVYYDDPNAVAQADLRSHAGLILAEGVAVPDGLEQITTHGGKTAILTYKGPYSGLKAAYDYLYGSWLPQSGQEPAEAACYEVYLNDPSQVPEDELLTEINLPLVA